MKLRVNSSHTGFTLIEILVTIAIIATLAASAWVAKDLVDAKQRNSLAETQISLLAQGMNAYRADNGDILPAGKGDAISAATLYSALFRDEDSDGNPDKDSSGNTLMPYCDQLVIISNANSPEREEGIPCLRIKISGTDANGNRVRGKRYAIIDPWNGAYRYRLGCEVTDENGRVGSGVNPDFDIFSLGPDGKGNGLTKDNDNEDNISNINLW